MIAAMKKTLVFLSVLAAASMPALAHAHEEPVSPEKRPSETPGAEHAEAEEHEEEKEPEWEVQGDFVAGATTVSILDEGRPGRVELPPQNKFASFRATSLSLLAGLERSFGERFKVGARIPIVDADLQPRDGIADPRAEFALGNIELEAAYVLARGKNWNVVGTLELALPTAGGVAQPTQDEVAKEPEKVYEYRRYDRAAASRAANAARGAYESALFEVGHIGIIPKLSANVHSGKLTFTPMVKVENMLDVTGDEADSYVGELVGGVRAGYLAAKWVEPGLHVWANLTYTEHDAFEALVVEPNVRFPLGRVTPSVGLLLPVAGNLVDDKSWGLRLAAAAEF